MRQGWALEEKVWEAEAAKRGVSTAACQIDRKLIRIGHIDYQNETDDIRAG